LNVAAIVLAAGSGSRMKGEHKLLAELDGKPVVRHSVEAALASTARPVIVVTGHESERVTEALSGLNVDVVHNPRHTEGLSSSVKLGISAVPSDCAAAAILLADMPKVSPGLIDDLLFALDPDRGKLIAVPTRNGQRGNPVAWSRALFGELLGLQGDMGAKHLIGAHQEAVVEVPADDDGIFLDIDTEEALAAARGVFQNGA
jgi:molybdenum cofactor cytidylyltransferase